MYVLYDANKRILTVRNSVIENHLISYIFIV